jgi:hypothetical protein
MRNLKSARPWNIFPAPFRGQRYSVQLFLMEMLREHALFGLTYRKKTFRRRRAAAHQNLQLTAIVKML